jgi:hypothetical protein
MSESLNRRRVISAALSLPAVAAAALAAGCSGGDPNQFVSGTLAKPLESVEREAERRGRAADAAKAKARGQRKR